MKLLRTALAAALMAGPVLAHEGDHTHMESAGALRHLLSEPDHLMILVLVAAIAAYPVARYVLKRVRK